MLFGILAFLLSGSFIALPIYWFLHFPLYLPMDWSAGISITLGLVGGTFSVRSEKFQDAAGWIWNIAASLLWWT